MSQHSTHVAPSLENNCQVTQNHYYIKKEEEEKTFLLIIIILNITMNPTTNFDWFWLGFDCCALAATNPCVDALLLFRHES